MVRKAEAARFIEVLTPAVRQAAAIARALEGRVRNRPKLGEASAVKAALTLADSAAQEAILVPLLENFPDVALRAEEDTPSVAGFPAESPDRPLVVLDPIDGTLRSYLERRGAYSVMLGLSVGGAYQASLLTLPREGLFYDATRGGGARQTRPGGVPRPARAELGGGKVLVSNGTPEPVCERLRESGLTPVPACGGAVSIAPLIPGVRAGLRIGMSPAGISVRGRIGLLIAREAGAFAWTAEGQPFPEEIEAPAPTLLLAADPGDLEALQYALEAARA